MKKLVVCGIVLALVTLRWSALSAADQPPAPRGELRIVDKSPVNWISMTFNVFEHFMEADIKGKLVPRGHRLAPAH
ncbi:MAG: hypothetical protein O7G88_07915 [bacterium]|nr:hypothetical protein [bacterium]